MNTEQLERPHEFIDQIGREPIRREWWPKHRGYRLYSHGSQRFGFVRFNIRGNNRGMYAVYALRYRLSDDPYGRFSPDAAQAQHLAFVNPHDEEEIGYALGVIHASYDRTVNYDEESSADTVDLIVTMQEMRVLDDTIENLIERLSAWKDEVEQASETVERIETIRTNVEHICAVIDESNKNE